MYNKLYSHQNYCKQFHELYCYVCHECRHIIIHAAFCFTISCIETKNKHCTCVMDDIHIKTIKNEAISQTFIACPVIIGFVYTKYQKIENTSAAHTRSHRSHTNIRVHAHVYALTETNTHLNPYTPTHTHCSRKHTYTQHKHKLYQTHTHIHTYAGCKDINTIKIPHIFRTQVGYTILQTFQGTKTTW